MPSVAGRGRGRRTINEINMVPFIDVMLVLLIIFMVTAPLITPSVIDLPSAGKASRMPDQIIQIVIGNEGRLELKLKDTTQVTNLQEVAKTVKATIDGRGGAAYSGSSAVIISADRNVKYENVVQVMDTLQRAGIQRVGLAVQLAP